MRRASVGVFALALGIAAPVAAKGPAWTSMTLEAPRPFGTIVLARGEAAIYRSGAPAFGTLEKPLVVSERVTLPEGTLVHFANTNITSDPPYRLTDAAVPGRFSACGVEFSTNTDPWRILVSHGQPVVPKGYTVFGIYGTVPVERSEHRDPVMLAGPVLDPLEFAGLVLPAGSTINFECEGPAPRFTGWSGEFERDTEVGGLLLRARTPATVAFAMLGPYAADGTLARPGDLHGRTLPAGARFTDYGGYFLATCPNARVSVFYESTWSIADCGTPVATESSGGDSATSVRASSRPFRASAPFPWTLGVLGIAAFFACVTLPLFLIRRRALGRT